MRTHSYGLATPVHMSDRRWAFPAMPDTDSVEATWRRMIPLWTRTGVIVDEATGGKLQCIDMRENVHNAVRQPMHRHHIEPDRNKLDYN